MSPPPEGALTSEKVVAGRRWVSGKCYRKNLSVSYKYSDFSQTYLSLDINFRFFQICFWIKKSEHLYENSIFSTGGGDMLATWCGLLNCLKLSWLANCKTLIILQLFSYQAPTIGKFALFPIGYSNVHMFCSNDVTDTTAVHFLFDTKCTVERIRIERNH